MLCVNSDICHDHDAEDYGAENYYAEDAEDDDDGEDDDVGGGSGKNVCSV